MDVKSQMETLFLTQAVFVCLLWKKAVIKLFHCSYEQMLIFISFILILNVTIQRLPENMRQLWHWNIK